MIPEVGASSLVLLTVARRKKCSVNTFPVCGACQRLNLECVREPRRQIVQPARQKSSTANQEADANVVPSVTYGSICPSVEVDLGVTTHAEARRYALKYYVTTLTQHYTISEQHNSFLSGERSVKELKFPPFGPALTRAI